MNEILRFMQKRDERTADARREIIKHRVIFCAFEFSLLLKPNMITTKSTVILLSCNSYGGKEALFFSSNALENFSCTLLSIQNLAVYHLNIFCHSNQRSKMGFNAPFNSSG